MDEDVEELPGPGQIDFDKKVRQSRARSEMIDRMGALLPRTLMTSDGKGVGRKILIGVLHIIADRINNPNDKAYPGHQYIAKRVTRDVKTVSHAIDVWERHEVLSVTRKTEFTNGEWKNLNSYHVNWQLIFDIGCFCQTDAIEWFESFEPTDQSELSGDQSELSGDQSELSPDQSELWVPPNPLEPKGIQNKESIARPVESRDGSRRKNGNGFFQIDISELVNPERVQELFELNCQWHPQHYRKSEPTHRAKFFAFCHHTYRQRSAESIQEPMALFVDLVKRGLDALQFDDDHDIAWAKRVIAELDGVVLVGSASHEAASVDLDWEIEDQREQQLQRDRGVALEAAYALGLANQENEQIIRERPSDFLRSLYQRRKQKAK